MKLVEMRRRYVGGLFRITDPISNGFCLTRRDFVRHEVGELLIFVRAERYKRDDDWVEMAVLSKHGSTFLMCNETMLELLFERVG